MAWTQEKIETTLKNVVEKAQVDAVFREKLKNNPREVLVAESHEAIPNTFRIGVIDQNDVDIVITLPKTETDELSDADLEHVAGGKGNPEKEEFCSMFGEGLRDYGREKNGMIGEIMTIPYMPLIYLASKTA